MKNSSVAVLLFSLISCLAQAQQVTSFDGISASQLSNKSIDIDPNGAIGTKQYVEWVNVYYQAYDKTTLAPVWSTPQVGTSPFKINGLSSCLSISGDGLVQFDRLASRWVISGHTSGAGGSYYECIAISNTDDLSSSKLAWYTYQFNLSPNLGKNSKGHQYFPDWPKMGTWSDGYYVSFDLLDVDNKYAPIGVLVCAFDRTHMLTGATPDAMQCFSDPDPIPTSGPMYLAHSLIPADVEGTTAPPAGREEYFLSIQNPPNDGISTTSNILNLWAFHVDWTTPANSSLINTTISVPVYTPGCYNLLFPMRTQCVPEPSVNNGTHYHIDSVGDRMMPRMSYRNFGTYESFLISQTVQHGVNGNKQTGIAWYELRGSGTPSLFQSGVLAPGGPYLFRFMPSIAQDKVGNAAVGYSTSAASIHPGIRASWWNLPKETAAKELTFITGAGDELNSTQWGDYTSMTVDPVDGCTFWYVNEYFPSNQSGGQVIWNTKISKFKISTCK